MAKNIKIFVVLMMGLLIGGFIGHSLNSSTEVTKSSISAKPQSSSGLPLDIKEMDIKLLSYLSLPELTYKYGKLSDGTEYAILYTPELSKYCPPDGPNAALGVLFKIKGEYSDHSLPMPGILLKQNENYFISYRPIQQECGNIPNTEKEELRSKQQQEVEHILLYSMNSF